MTWGCTRLRFQKILKDIFILKNLCGIRLILLYIFMLKFVSYLINTLYNMLCTEQMLKGLFT